MSDHPDVVLRRAAVAIAAAIGAVSLMGTVAAVAAGPAVLRDGLWFGELGAFLSFGIVGVVIATRRPRHTHGWLMLAIAGSATLRIAASAYAHLSLITHDADLPFGVMAAWLTQWVGWLPIGLAFTTLLLWFPNGRPPSPRWRWVAWAAFGALALLVFSSATTPKVAFSSSVVSGDGLARVDNPFAIAIPDLPRTVMDMAGGVALILSAFLSVGSLFVRRRRADAQERLQLRWLTLAGGLNVVIFVGSNLLQPSTAVADLLFGGGIALLALGVGLPVLRYRLYEIDRIVSRTVAYGAVTITLVGLYSASILGLGAILPGGGSDLVVAGSTLAAASLVRPLLSRVQSVVDRRFNRSRVDAARVVEALGQRLRDEVDATAITGHLRAALDEALAPSKVVIWMRP